MTADWHRIDDPENPPPRDGTPVLLWGEWAWWFGDDNEVTVRAGVAEWFIDEWIGVTSNPYQDRVRPTLWSPITPPVTP